MNRKRTGLLLSALGAACMFGYVLTALRGVSPFLVRVGGVLFYVGIGALLAGVVFRWFGSRDGRTG